MHSLSLFFQQLLLSFSFMSALESLGCHFHHCEAKICNSHGCFSKHSFPWTSAFTPVNVWYPLPIHFGLSPNYPLGFSLMTLRSPTPQPNRGVPLLHHSFPILIISSNSTCICVMLYVCFPTRQGHEAFCFDYCCVPSYWHIFWHITGTL